MNEKYPLALPEGTVLAGQYIVERVLGQGGFGITYEAKDHKTGGRVALKEFFPDAMATRTNQTTVLPFSGEKGESYVYGKTCFLQEAETLAKFIGNENIVRIHSYFEENGTAYFVMDFIEGTSFDTYLKQRGGKISFDEAARILIPVMDALSVVHSKGIIHRDVTPDNIYITQEGVVKLLDFGAARYSLGDQSRSLDIILKHGFAPKEQYTRRGKQGPYTDIYALGATFYFALTGKRPPDSVERLDEDDLVPPSSLGVQLSGAEEDAILKALSVQPADRFQSMMAFKSALLNSQQGGAAPQPAAAGSQIPVSQTFFPVPEQTGISQPGPADSPVTGSGQDTDLQDLAATMKTAGRLAGKLTGKMAGKMAEKAAETAGIMAGTAGKMSEIMAAKKAETAEKLAAKAAEWEAEKAAKAAEKAARQEAERAAAEEAARQAAEEAARQAAEEAARRQAAEAAAQQAAVGASDAPGPDAVGQTVGVMAGSAAGDVHPSTPVSTAESMAGSAPAKPAMDKKLLLIPAAVAAVALVAVFALKPWEAKQAVIKGSESSSSQSMSSVQTDISAPPPDISEPDASIPVEPEVTLSGDWSIVGSTAGNIMNNGLCVTPDGGSSLYFIQDNDHSIWSSVDNGYIFENEDGAFSSLSFEDGKLYFLFQGIAFSYSLEDGDTQEVEELRSLSDGTLQRLILTKDFYVLCGQNSNGTFSVYRVLRANGEVETCCTVANPNCFTMSDDGWIYYTFTESDGTASVYRMRLDTLEMDDARLIHATNPDFAFCNPVVAGDYLYLLDYAKDTYQSYSIVRIDRESGYQNDDPVWNIASELKLTAMEDGLGFNVCDLNQIIYFHIFSVSDAGETVPDLYEIRGGSDSTFEIKRLSQNSFFPNILPMSDGSYKVDYMHYSEDDGVYKIYYRNFDADGTQLS